MKIALKENRNSPVNEEGCRDCGGELIIADFERMCCVCGLIDCNYLAVEFVGGSRRTPKYIPSMHFEAVLNRIQGMRTAACDRFNEDYIQLLKDRLGEDYSLANIHKHLPNKDQRYLNFVYYELTGNKLFINLKDRDFLKAMFNRCYDHMKRPCSLNILEVIVDRYSELDYIRPFIYTKFKLDKDIYNSLRNVHLN